MHKKGAILILDGWGHGQIPEVSAIAQADTPYVDSLYKQYPNAELVTYGGQVGLPDGQMGNSEVGHLNIGAGRIVFQELARINNAINDHSLDDHPVILEGIAYAVKENKPIHLLGLLSDGGVHSHISHITALCHIIRKHCSQPIYIHAFLDGRDTDPHGGAGYLETLLKDVEGLDVTLSTIIGRYYAMDRDKRWERIKKAYDLLIHGKGNHTDDAIETVKSEYKNEHTDEFMPAIKVGNDGLIEADDVVFFSNFRTDRPRQLTTVLTQEDMPDFGMKTLPLYYITMTNYDSTYEGIKVVFEKDNLKQTIGEVMADQRLTQLRMAETEKYPHVTFFLNGGREEPFDGEARIVVPSPKVATYDLQPEMSALEVKDQLMNHVKKHHPDFICLNFANTDMVGHTGVMSAAIKAVETVDGCLKEIVPLLIEENYEIIIIADHGNSDIMINPDGSPHTAHTTNPVPVIYVSQEADEYTISDGKLGDIAPTLLHAMGIAVPSEMTGLNLITLKDNS